LALNCSDVFLVALEEIPSLLVVLTVLHELGQIESALLVTFVLLWLNNRFLAIYVKRSFPGSQEAFFFVSKYVLSVTENGRGAIEALTASINSNEAVLATTVRDTHGDFPVGNKFGVKAVLNARFFASQNLGGVFLEQICKFLVKARGFLKIGVEARSNTFHILNVNLVEETVDALIVASDVVHLRSDQIRVDILNLKLAVVLSKTMRVEVEGLTSSHWVQAFNSFILIAFRINLNVTHDLSPGLNNGRDDPTKIEDHLGRSVAESFIKFPHELFPLLFSLREILVTEFLEVLN
jgi:hypothetical protein